MYKRFFILQLELLAYTLWGKPNKNLNFSYCAKDCQSQLSAIFDVKAQTHKKKHFKCVMAGAGS